MRAFLVSARTRLQRYINPDGSLKNTNSSTTSRLNETSQPELGLLLTKHSSSQLADQEQLLLETVKLVDTTLFRAYMFASPSLVGPLFRIDNFCDPDVVNEKLTETGRYNDLVDFFYGKKLHRQALQLLKKFGQKDSDDEAAPQLVGPRRTVAYLQSLPPEMTDLILEFAEWPIKIDPELGMEIFLADTENAETLPRSRVIEFLRGINRKLVARYLEHIIHELNDTTPDFHQDLINIYLDGLRSNEFTDDEEKSSWRDKTLDFLRTSKNYQPYKALRQVSVEGIMNVSNLAYSSANQHFADPNLYEARAIVLSKMGQNRQALDIYVFKLNDPEKAEECESPKNRFYISSLTVQGFVIRYTSQKQLQSHHLYSLDGHPPSTLRMRPLPSITPFYLYISRHHTRINRNGALLSIFLQSTALVCPPLPRSN